MKDNNDRIVISPDFTEFQELNFTCALNREDKPAFHLRTACVLRCSYTWEGKVKVAIHQFQVAAS